VIEVSRDITESKKAEEDVRISSKKDESILFCFGFDELNDRTNDRGK